MSPALDVSLNVLYVQGPRLDVDQAATDELRTASAELQITTIAGPAAALAELRRTPGWQALVVSPTLPQNETLALIASVRRDRIPIAIVPIIDDTHQELFASAVASGADDVLVRRANALVSIRESLTRIRQSPHLFPAEQRRRISVLYAGRDPLVWNLLAQVPFVRADRATVTIDGACSVRRPGAGDDSLRADAVIIDEAPGEAHPLQVLKSVKAQASDMPVIMLTSAGGADIATAALELGADDTVLKTGIFRRRLIATLRRVHQRIEITAQQQETRAREERLRQIVENVPTGIMVVSGDGRVLAMNAAALQLFHASRPRDIVGRDFRELTAEPDREALGALLRQVTKGEPGTLDFGALTLAGGSFAAHVDAVMLERDARGNRGLVVSIGRAGVAEAPAAELAGLREELERHERHYAAMEDARARERAAWEAERRELATKLEAAERLAAERDALARRLEEVTAELTRAGEAFAAERDALERQLRELEGAAAQASAADATLAEALDRVRGELQQTISSHAVERSGWEAIRGELEERVRHLDESHRSEHETVLASLRDEIRQLEQTLADERARWDETRDQIEADLRNTREALWHEHRERDAAREAFEAELRSLREELDQERTARHTQEEALRRESDDRRLALADAEAQLERARAAWIEERAALEAARERATLALEVERAAWRDQRETIDEERRRLAERLASIDEAGGSERLHELEEARQRWEAERAALEAARQQAIAETARTQDMLRAAREDADATRTAFAQERDDARAAADAATRALTELEARHGAAQAELAALHQRIDALASFEPRAAALEQDLDAARAEHERAQESLRALTDEYDATRTRLEQERDDARGAATAASQALTDLEARHGAAQDELAALRQRVDALAALEPRTAALEQDLHTARADCARAQESLRALTEEYDATRTKLEQERGELQAGLAEAAARADAAGHALELAREEHEAALAARQQDEDRARGELEQRLAGLEDALARARADQERLEADAREAGERLERRLADAVSQAEQERGRLVALHARDQEEWREAIDRARGERERLASHAGALEATLAADRRQLAQLEVELQTARSESGEARRQLAELDEERIESRRRLAALTERLEAARTEIRHTDEAHQAERERWQAQTAALEARFADLESRLAMEREGWTRERAGLEAEAGEAARLGVEARRLQDTVAALRSECEHLAAEADHERGAREQDHLELEALRASLAGADQRVADARAAADRAARSTIEELERARAAREARIDELEAERRRLNDRLADQAAEAAKARAGLQASYEEVARARARLIGMDAFAHALTTTAGELVSCNDAFARIFGYVNAAEALTRAAGRPFPGLAGRRAVDEQLRDAGQASRIVSCVERVDGTPVRILEWAAVVPPRPDDQGRELVEHVILAGPSGPSDEERRARRLQEVGALTTAMMPELETLVGRVSDRLGAIDAPLPALPAAAETDALRVATMQARTLVQQLATFSRRQMRGPESVDLADVVSETEAVLAKLAGDYVPFTTALHAVTPIAAQREDVVQLITSMVTLGRDLLPAGGALVIELRQQTGTAVDGEPGPVLAVGAQGYGVQTPGPQVVIEQLARRCGGVFRVAGEAGWNVRLEVLFPRCPPADRPGWGWLAE